MNNWGWTNGPLSEGKYEFDLYAGAGNNDLSKGTLVGKLEVEYRNGKVSVTYDMKSGFTLKEAQLYIGSDYLPKKGRSYTNSPGQFEYGKEFRSGTDSHEFEAGWYRGKIYIAAHAVVECSQQGEDDKKDDHSWYDGYSNWQWYGKGKNRH